jgi:hypothetical protein
MPLGLPGGGGASRQHANDLIIKTRRWRRRAGSELEGINE